MKLLRDIAEIRSGFPFRERPDRVESGGCRLVQMRDVSQGMGIVLGNVETVKEPANWEEHRLRMGDIVLTARGQTNSAAIFASELPNAIAASTLLVIRVRDDEVSPFYLVWYLNLPRTQQQLQFMQAGSSISFISIEDLGQLPVPVPGMAEQDKIFELESLHQEEQALMNLLQLKRHELILGIQQTLLKKTK